MKFLAGLNTDLDEVRGRVVGKEPLLSISKAFLKLDKKKVVGEWWWENQLTNGENSTLNATLPANKTAATTYNRKPVAQISNSPNEKPKVWCGYCNKSQHTREKCLKLKGKPTNWKERKPGEKNGCGMQATAEIEILFIKEQLEHLYRMMNEVQLSSVPSVFGLK